MSDPLRHFDNLICIAEFVPMSDERKEMVRQAASEIARLRLTDAEREAISDAYDFLCDRARELQNDKRLEESIPLVQLAKTLQGLWERLGGSDAV